jgi:hypothetical protein
LVVAAAGSVRELFPTHDKDRPDAIAAARAGDKRR